MRPIRASTWANTGSVGQSGGSSRSRSYPAPGAWPGTVQPGSRSRGMVSNLELRRDVPGRGRSDDPARNARAKPLAAAAGDRSPPTGERVCCCRCWCSSTTTSSTAPGVVTDRFKLVHFYEPGGGRSGAVRPHDETAGAAEMSSVSWIAQATSARPGRGAGAAPAQPRGPRTGPASLHDQVGGNPPHPMIDRFRKNFTTM